VRDDYLERVELSAELRLSTSLETIVGAASRRYAEEVV